MLIMTDAAAVLLVVVILLRDEEKIVEMFIGNRHGKRQSRGRWGKKKTTTKQKATTRDSLVESLVRGNRIRFPLNEIGISLPIFIIIIFFFWFLLPTSSLLHFTARKTK